MNNQPDIEEVIRSSEIIVHSGRYAYLKCTAVPQGSHFLVTRDNDEITVITEEAKITGVEYTADNKWWKLLEIRVAIPFLPGFLAQVTTTLAAKKLNCLIVSTFSKDYALIRDESADMALLALKERGFPVTLG